MEILEKKVNISIKTFVTIASIVSFLVAGYYGVTYKLEEAKSLPRPGTGQYFIDRNDNNATITWPPSRGEFEFKYNALLNKLETLEKEFNEYKKNHPN